ncbi:hypothetical protein Ccrd_002441 [Cynara cardunculus var. scolymus]|uniref:Glycine-rich protein n=1 Tax=Cynara cardunculus var. scolymus TaxID=59895 RepID=A0A103XRF0_CYNCS|nr:hypothetical protein Ccrd_002441 [Cynara cardunculus var. scolymus]
MFIFSFATILEFRFTRFPETPKLSPTTSQLPSTLYFSPKNHWILVFNSLRRYVDNLKKMQGGRGRGNPFFGFGDPFAGFGGMPSLFGGRDPFDDPFFTQPLGGMLQPSPFGHAGNSFMGVSPFGNAGNPIMGVNSFGSSLYGSNGSPFMDAHAPRIHEHRQSLSDSSRGLIIEELNSDNEKEEPEAGHGKKENPHKHGRSARQHYVEQPDDGTKERELKQTQYGNQFSIMHDTHSRPQAHSFTFESSTVTYGGSNGEYYTSSSTRRAGSDGLRFEEHKKADSLTGQAAHRISRGIYDKGRAGVVGHCRQARTHVQVGEEQVQLNHRQGLGDSNKLKIRCISADI